MPTRDAAELGMCSSADLDLDPPVTFDEVHQFCAAVKGSVPSTVFDSFVEVAMRLPAAGVPAFVACAHIEAVLGDKGSYELLMQLGILYPPYGARLAAASAASAAAEQLNKVALPAPAAAGVCDGFTAAPAPPNAFSAASTVSFGGAAPPAPSCGLFGGTPPAPSGGLFGGTAAPAPSGGLFGGTAPAPSGGLFGGAAAPAPASGATPAQAAADRRGYRAAAAERRVTVFGFAPRASSGGLVSGGLVPPAPSHAVEFIRFRATGTRLPSCAELQIAQLVVFDALGTALTLTDAINPGGVNPPNEEPAKALDGTPKTKWLDARKGALECRLAKGAAVLGKYMLMTANDCPERDPIRWVLEGSSLPPPCACTCSPRRPLPWVLEGSSLVTPLCMHVLTTAPSPLFTGGCSRDGRAQPIHGVSSTTRAARISRCPPPGTRRMRSCCRPRAAGCSPRAAASAQISRCSLMRARSSWAHACASGTASLHRKVGGLSPERASARSWLSNAPPPSPRLLPR